MFTIGVNEMWHFWFVEEIFAVPNHWMFNMGVVVAFMGALAYVVRVYARLVELGAETPGENPYVAEMYKMALEGKLYSRSMPSLAYFSIMPSISAVFCVTHFGITSVIGLVECDLPCLCECSLPIQICHNSFKINLCLCHEQK